MLQLKIEIEIKVEGLIGKFSTSYNSCFINARKGIDLLQERQMRYQLTNRIQNANYIFLHRNINFLLRCQGI